MQWAQLWHNALSNHWRTGHWPSEKPGAQLGMSSALDFVFLLQGSINLALFPSCLPLCLFAKSPLRTFSPEEGWAKVITLVLNCHKFALLCEALQKPVVSPTQKIYYWDVRMGSSWSPVGLLCASTLSGVLCCYALCTEMHMKVTKR